MREKSYTVDNNTYASNPGNAILKPLVWMKYNFFIVFILSLSVLLSIFLIIISRWFLILPILLLKVNHFYWLRQKEHFKHGDSNGGLVVSLKPNLVAVKTDLTKGFGKYPVIKVIHYKITRNVNIGDRVPTVALYTASMDEDLPHWINFNPIPLKYATNDKQTYIRALESYNEEDWIYLEEALKEIPQPYRSGLYKIKTKDNNW